MIACLFDIDGTLLASGGAGKAALESSLCEEFGVCLREQVPYSGRTDRAIARELLEKHDLAHTLENWQKLRDGYLRRLPDSLNRHHGRVLPGMIELLQNLKARPGVALGLLTGNIRTGAQVKLGHYGLYEHFAFGGFGDDHFDRDDVARAALHSVQECVGPHCGPDQVWVIGDTPLDVQCARAIGARVVAVATGMHTFEQLAACSPDLVVHDFSDASAFLKLCKLE
jgi:phosphoglycolate phosphatase-like HAD superfamily hydrolase